MIYFLINVVAPITLTQYVSGRFTVHTVFLIRIFLLEKITPIYLAQLH